MPTKRRSKTTDFRQWLLGAIPVVLAFATGASIPLLKPVKPISAVGIAVCDVPVGAIVVYSDGTQRRITGSKMAGDEELQRLIEDEPAEKLGILKLCPQPAKPQVY